MLKASIALKLGVLVLLTTAVASCGYDVTLPQSASGGGVYPGNPLPTQSLGAQQFLQEANAKALAASPQARFYLLVGHDIDAQGSPDPSTSGYWVASYGVSAPYGSTGGNTNEVLAVRSGPDGTLSLSRLYQQALGYVLKTPYVPQVDSAAAVQTAASNTPGLQAPYEIKLYTPLVPEYWSTSIYYVSPASAQSPMIGMVNAQTGSWISPTPGQ